MVKKKKTSEKSSKGARIDLRVDESLKSDLEQMASDYDREFSDFLRFKWIKMVEEHKKSKK